MHIATGSSIAETFEQKLHRRIWAYKCMSIILYILKINADGTFACLDALYMAGRFMYGLASMLTGENVSRMYTIIRKNIWSDPNSFLYLSI